MQDDARQRHNLQQAISSLESLISVEKDTAARSRYDEDLTKFNLQLKNLSEEIP